jgi:hypothetical protein
MTLPFKTLDELKALILAALSADGEITDRAGRSSYDQICGLINHLTSSGRTSDVVDVLVSIAEENRNKSVQWWLAFAVLFDDVHQLTLREKNRFVEVLEHKPPNDMEARAYFLRLLAYLGYPVKWQRKLADNSLKEMVKGAPLSTCLGRIVRQGIGNHGNVIT